MKSFKTFFAVVIVALVFSACEKSDIKPHCITNETAEPASQNINPSVNERTRTSGLPGVVVTPGGPVKDIVGSGDDDRDGGDKKSKAPGR